jgi:hypothetical protein
MVPSPSGMPFGVSGPCSGKAQIQLTSKANNDWSGASGSKVQRGSAVVSWPLLVIPTGGTFVTLSCPAVTLADALASRSTPEDPTENPTAPVTVVDWLCA